ncbi:MAG: spore protease YyaC [Thermoanaerobacteraceae bacterium]
MEFIDINSKTPHIDFYKSFYKYMNNLYKYNQKIIILAIGTDRSTGDSLGPIIGQKLKLFLRKKADLFGTLDNPIHAKNINQTIDFIEKNYTDPFIIAIDACLGSLNHVGYISLGSGPIRPGAGVSKDLPPVGNMFVTGIVNISGFMEYIVLQNTRLNLVMKMADVISFGIFRTINDIYIKNLERA